MIRVVKVDFRVDLRAARGVEEVSDQWERIAIFLSELVETVVVDT